MMLSTTAERLYWSGRYLERAENTARLVRVNTDIILDLPVSIGNFWQHIVTVVGSEERYDSIYDDYNERNVVKYMLADQRNPGSLSASVHMARENLRTTREVMPSASWVAINRFHLYSEENVSKAITRKNRDAFLERVVDHCHQFRGIVEGMMSRSDAYQFLNLGRSIERADMTTRLLDVASAQYLDKSQELDDAFQNALWMNILQSCSAHQMYIQNVKDTVNGKNALEFLLLDNEFPRSVIYTLSRIISLATQLPHNDDVLRSVAQVSRTVANANTSEIIQGDLHQYLDNLQLSLSNIHGEIEKTWFTFDQAK